MADTNPPKSPTLLPPRKSVELEDPGAHDLDSSNDEEEVFSDARDSDLPISAPHSPIPITRVEKVDDTPRHGQVPGTAAYEMRTQDAVPDELEIIPEGGGSRSSSSLGGEDRSRTPGGTIIPKMVVEKIDPSSPSHGEVPGTAAHSLRKADAVPDVILQAPISGRASPSNISSQSQQSKMPIPTTIVTKVDSESSHGEIPDTASHNKRTMDAAPDVVEEKDDVPGWPTSSLNRSSYSNHLGWRSSLERTSPIAADGGFGPMEYDESDHDDRSSEEKDPQGKHGFDEAEEENTDEEGLGDEFDDFEEGAADDDFGEFDDGFEQPLEQTKESTPPLPPKSFPSIESPFPLVDFSDSSLPAILTALEPHLSALFPSASRPTPTSTPPTPPPQLLTSRSLSLWTQLIAPPPLQPPNWVRSRIRRLFLVSLGVPVDLDEILPASKQKKLVLPFTPSDASTPQGQGHKASLARLKSEQNDSSTSLASSTTTTANKPSTSQTQTQSQKKRKGPLPPPPLDYPALRTLCSTTDTALAGMETETLRMHTERLETLTAEASKVLEYWLMRKDAAVGEKEAFEGVIANLVRFVIAKRERK